MQSKKARSLTRREFLKTTGKVAAVSAVGGKALGMFGSTASAAKRTNAIVAYNQEAVQFNPLLWTNTGTESCPENCVFDALWEVAPNGQFLPNLAVRVPSFENGGISPDGLTWRIELKRGVKWQDGYPFNASDVEFTFKTILNPKVAVRSRAGFDLIKEFKVIDDYNIQLVLSRVHAPFIWSWQNMHIVPEHILSKVPDIMTAPYNQKPIGTGPFLFEERVAGSHIVYKKNPNYHMPGLPKLDTVIQKFVPDQNVEYTQFKLGEIDFLGTVGISPERYEEAKTFPGRFVWPHPMNSIEFIYFNCERPQFTDPRVRKALYWAFDKDKIIKDLYYGTVIRSLSYLKPNHWAYNTELKDPGYKPREAAQLLDAAGWKVGPDGIREKDGLKLQFTNSTTAGNKAREQAQVLIQQQWKEIGVAMEIKNFPGAVVWGDYYVMSKFDTLMVAHGPFIGVDPDYYSRAHSSQIAVKTGAGSNYCQYSNPVVDKLLEEGRTTYDRGKRKEIYWKVQRLFDEDVPFAPIFNWVFILGRNAALQGNELNYYVENTWDIQNWYWE